MGDLISLIQRGRVLTEEGTQGENRFPCRRWGRLLGKAEETALEWVPEEEAGVCQGDGMGTGWGQKERLRRRTVNNRS